MPKAYWITQYRAITDPDKFTAYAKLAGPALTGAGGTFLARGAPVKVFEAGLDIRTVLVEFASLDSAVAAYHSPAYQAALRVLDNGAERDIRFIEAADASAATAGARPDGSAA
ncbi:DUF1330 domain-containing protein [Trinickia diaoshuihuensis]|uniref:DUF1330 domain-containing protein n=1 Tax=Trinickia diaoshuihuensis TaxID=2292265 RepID=UPI000E241594|nr:DUF1330 domain-containing protein [Trinickia diaoshuihuensis]